MPALIIDLEVTILEAGKKSVMNGDSELSWAELLGLVFRGFAS